MDGYRHQELIDETLEKDIEAALGVDPSPEFLPRIRARIANERMQEGWFSSASWRWAIVLAGATAVVVLGLWIVREPAPAREVARAVPPPVVEPPPSVPEVIVSVPETARTSEDARGSRSARLPALPRAAPDVRRLAIDRAARTRIGEGRRADGLEPQ